MKAGTAAVLVCLVLGVVGTMPPPSQVFSQKVCNDSACTVDCQVYWYPMFGCVDVAGGGSAMIVGCLYSGMEVLKSDAASCHGYNESSNMTVSACAKNPQGGYFETSCGVAPNATQGKEMIYVHRCC